MKFKLNPKLQFENAGLVAALTSEPLARHLTLAKAIPMCATNRFAFVGLLSLSCAAPISTYASPCGGININHTVNWEPTEISKGSSLAQWRGSSVTVSNDPKGPFHLISGECKGTLHVGSDGSMRGIGSCARRDKDGDVLFEDYEHEGRKGTSRLVGGTGKFAKAAGNLQWENIPLQGKTAAVPWSGDCRL